MVKVERIEYRVGGRTECDACWVGSPILFRVTLGIDQGVSNICVDCLVQLLNATATELAAYVSPKVRT
jgi:hypothetical protein